MTSLENISFMGTRQLIEGAEMVLREKVDSLNYEVADLISVPDALSNWFI